MSSPKLPYERYADKELFGLIQQDDTGAFEAFYRRYWPLLTDIAYKRIQSRAKAEDLVQDLFINLYQKRHTLEFTVSLEAYLRQALKYKVLNEFRSQNIRNQYQQSIFFSPVCKNDFAKDLEAKDLNKKIDKVMELLPEKCKIVFLLSRKENQTNKEISTCLQISISTVEKHISKALKVLRQCMQQYEVAR